MVLQWHSCIQRVILYVGLSLISVAAKAQEEGWLWEYEQFRREAEKEYSDFREKANKEYAEFLRTAWKEYHALQAPPAPKEEPVPPVVYEPPVKEDTPAPQPVPYEEIVPTPAPAPQPQPIAPVIENSHPDHRLQVEFYGTTLSLRYPQTTFRLSDTSPSALAAGWEALTDGTFDNLLYDCLELRSDLQLCDWAYLSLLQTITEKACGKSNAAVLMQASLYAQSGYQMRMGVSPNGRLYLLAGSPYSLYDKAYFVIDGMQFYPLDCEERQLSICGASFEGEQPLSLLITKEQHLASAPSPVRTLQSRAGITAHVCTNHNLTDFYNRYPTGQLGEDFGTRWAAYANTPLDTEVRRQLYPALKNAIADKDEAEAVGLLLDFVQTAFVYEYDSIVWGGDRAFFAEETLYYPYCDCEDRSILFSRIVRDLTDLNVVLLYYPGHLATAVEFREAVKGDWLMLNGKKYVVCDPTYIGAPIGKTMPGMDNSSAKVIVLDK